MNTAVAQHLNVTKELILEVREWAKVLWVRVQGMRPCFVSKKVVQVVKPKPILKPKATKTSGGGVLKLRLNRRHDENYNKYDAHELEEIREQQMMSESEARAEWEKTKKEWGIQ